MSARWVSACPADCFFYFLTIFPLIITELLLILHLHTQGARGRICHAATGHLSVRRRRDYPTGTTNNNYKKNFMRKLRIPRMALTAVLLMAATSLFGQRQERQLTTWRFTLGDNTAYSNTTLDESKWQTVRIPHDWAIAGPFDKEIDKQVAERRDCAYGEDGTLGLAAMDRDRMVQDNSGHQPKGGACAAELRRRDGRA